MSSRRPIRFLWLLCALVLIEFAFPVWMQASGRGTLVALLLSLVVIAGLRPLYPSRRLFVVSVALAVLGLVVQLVGQTAMQREMLLVHSALVLAGLAILIVVIVGHVLRVERVDADKLVGAVCAYLLLALIWCVAYMGVETLQSGSFRLDPGASAGNGENALFAPLLYFSFTTLTTLGYGDVLPLTPIARTLATAEAVAGVLFVAVLISRLVGLHITQGVRDGIGRD